MMCTNNLFRLVAKLRKHKPCHDIRRALTTNIHEYNCPYRLFAKTHPDVARELLKVPPHYPGHNTTPILSKDEKLEDYLSWRGWNIKGKLDRHKLDNESVVSAAIGLLSHPLTFPLTLGRYISEMISHDNTNYEQKKDIRICCVGARAEATLPDDYWREFLIITSTVVSESSITIDFIGPDIPSNFISSKTLSLSDNNNDDDGHIQHNKSNNLTMNYHKSFLHDVILNLLKSLHEQQKDTLLPPERTKKIRNIWDGYVLFNPGIGHPNLKKDWIPTLKFLIETRKPILFTAHSTIDADRDSKVLEKMLINDENNSDRIVEYKPNPYASRMKFVDPFPTSPNTDDTSVHLVRPNDQVFLLNRR